MCNYISKSKTVIRGLNTFFIRPLPDTLWEHYGNTEERTIILEHCGCLRTLPMRCTVTETPKKYNISGMEKRGPMSRPRALRMPGTEEATRKCLPSHSTAFRVEPTRAQGISKASRRTWTSWSSCTRRTGTCGSTTIWKSGTLSW